MAENGRAPDADHYLRSELYELARSDDRILEFLQAGSLDGIWYWDLEQTDHEWMSPKFWRTFGYDPADREHLASEWQDMIHPDDLATALENFQAHCADPSHPYDQYVRYRHRLGHWTWVRCRGIAIRDEAGTPRRMLGVHLDVTELKQAEARQRELLAEAKAANEELNLFAYAASHDLQSPIKSMAGLLELLKLEVEQEGRPSSGTVDRMDQTLGRMQGLVDSVLFLAQAKASAPPRVPVALKPLVETLLQELDVPAAATLTLEGLGAILANETLLVRALRNVFNNSLMHAAADRSLRLTVRQDHASGMDRIHVLDNGTGIEPGTEQSVFDLFSRGDHGGHGLGLAIVRRIVEAHGGTATVTRLDPGLSVTLALPSA